MAKMKMKSGAALLPMLLMAGAAVVAVSSPVFAGFEMKSYAPAPVPVAAPQEMPAPPPGKTPAAAGGEVIPGFGSSLPLAVALQQVAPPGYQFSFAGGVDPGTTVSWTGGKPWQQVLADMLAAQKLGYRLQNNIIAIDRLPAEIAPLTPAAIAAAVAPPPSAPLLASADEDLDEAFADERVKMDPVVTRRNNRRTSVSTRRDFAVEGRRTWLDRLKDNFKKHDEAKAEKTRVEKEKAATQQKTAVAEKDIQWSAEAPEQKMPSAPAASVESMALAAPPSAIQWSDNNTEADGPAVSGFGADMPLAIALQQVVPSGYDLSYAAGINKNTNVSWEGGKPWQQVLADMLAPQKLGYQVDGNIVAISRLADKKTAPPQTASRDESGQLLAPLALTRREEAKEASVPEMAVLPEKTIEEIPAAAPRDPIVSRRNAIAGSRDSATGQRSWMERLKERFNFKKGDQGKETETAPVKTAEESAAPELTVPETSAPGAMTSRRRERAAEMPPAVEVAPPPAAVPLMAAAKPAAEKPAAAPVTEAAPPPPAKPVWLAAKDRTLKDVLSEWSKTAGVELYWSTDYDYYLKGNIAYSGSFDEAVGQLLGGFTEIRPQPYGRLHQLQDGSRVLVVNTYTLYN